MTWGNRTPKVRSGEDLVRFAGLRRWACACRRASRRPESATNQKNRAVLWVTGERLNFFGGEGGIRTLDTGLSPYNALAGRHLRPLGHLSVFDLSYQCCQHCPAIRVTRGRQVAPGTSQLFIFLCGLRAHLANRSPVGMGTGSMHCHGRLLAKGRRIPPTPLPCQPSILVSTRCLCYNSPRFMRP